jgi:hypothetical protein
MRTILSFTTIPPRFKFLGRVLRQLEKQTVRPDRVELHLPRHYRRFAGEKPSLPPLPDWLDVFECENDLGPATKVLPAAQKWRGSDVRLHYFDDDQKYDSRWLERFAAMRKKRADDVLCERGFHLDEISTVHRQQAPTPAAKRLLRDGRTWGYRVKRSASLWLWKPLRHGFSASGYIDVAEGNGGVSIKPDWLDDLAMTIPGPLWTVDDVWLSGMLARAGHRIWVDHTGFIQNSFPEASKLHPLYKHSESGVNRREANQLCVDYLRDNFGIWL